MNQLAAWIHAPFATALGWALVHFLWEGVALALVLAALLFLFRPASSRRRYAIACATMFAMPVVFGITLLLILAAEKASPVTPPAPATALASARAALPAWDASFIVRVWQRPWDRLPWVVPCWILGVLVLYLRAGAGWLLAQRLRSRGVCSVPAIWRERLNELCSQMRVTRPVVLLESCIADAPLVIGYLRPVILMPLGCLTGLTTAQVECILVHELAHIGRHDYLVNLLQDLVEGLLFYHPAVWWVSGVVTAERENCCDDRVVEMKGDARIYAATLALLEHRRAPAPRVAMAATGGSLMNRIHRLLSEPHSFHVSAAPAFTTGFLLLTVGTGLSVWPAEPIPQRATPAQSARFVGNAAQANVGAQSAVASRFFTSAGAPQVSVVVSNAKPSTAAFTIAAGDLLSITVAAGAPESVPAADSYVQQRDLEVLQQQEEYPPRRPGGLPDAASDEASPYGKPCEASAAAPGKNRREPGDHPEIQRADTQSLLRPGTVRPV